MSANLGEISDIKGVIQMLRGQFLSQRDKEGKSYYILTTNFNNVKKKHRNNSHYLVSTFYALSECWTHWSSTRNITWIISLHHHKTPLRYFHFIHREAKKLIRGQAGTSTAWLQTIYWSCLTFSLASQLVQRPKSYLLFLPMHCRKI